MKETGAGAEASANSAALCSSNYRLPPGASTESTGVAVSCAGLGYSRGQDKSNGLLTGRIVSQPSVLPSGRVPITTIEALMPGNYPTK